MGPTFLCLPRTKSLPKLSARPAQRLSLLGHSSDSSRLRISSGGVNVIRLLLYPNFCIHIFFLIIFDQRRAPASILVMHIGHAFFAYPASFPHIPFVYCNFNTLFNNTSVNIYRPDEQFLPLVIVISTEIHRYRDFRYGGWGWGNMTPYHEIHSLSLR